MITLSLYHKIFLMTCCITLKTAAMITEPTPQPKSSYMIFIENMQKKHNELSLRHAVEKNNISEIESLIKQNVNINAPDSKTGNSALHLTCMKGNAKIAKILLSNNADFRLKNKYEETPLDIAMHMPHVHMDIIDTLYQYGAYLTHDNCKGESPTEKIIIQKNPLSSSHHASLLCVHVERLAEIASLNEQLWNAARCNNAKELNDLLDKGANINYQDIWFKETTLHVASFYGHLEIIELLLKKGIRLNIKNIQGNTALHIALQRQQFTIALALLEHGIDFIIKNKNGHPAEHYLMQQKGKLSLIHAYILHARLQALCS